MPSRSIYGSTIGFLIHRLEREDLNDLRRFRFEYQVGPFGHRDWKRLLNRWRTRDLLIADHITQKFPTRKGLIVATGDGHTLFDFALEIQRLTTRGGL